MSFPKITAKAGGGGKDFELVPAGVHMAICKEVIHLGVQKGFGTYPDRDKVYFAFEIPSVRVKWTKNGVEHEGPAKIGKTFTLSIGEKSNLRPFLVSWRGKEFSHEEEAEFDVGKFLGKICQLSIVHEVGRDGKEHANISTAMGLSAEQKAYLTQNPEKAKPEGELIAFSPDAYDKVVYEKLPNWLKEKISTRVKPEDASQATPFDDDIPF